MSVIDLRKKATENLIDLSKKATVSVSRHGLQNQKARVALCLDISGSMQKLYNQGVVQEVTEKLLGLAMNFDDNGAADVFLFGIRDHEVGEIDQSNFFQFVDREIVSRFALEGGTNYGGVMQRIANYYYPGAVSTVTEKSGFLGLGSRTTVTVDNRRYLGQDPVYVLFITDGDNQDKKEATKMMQEVSKLGIFWQFVGVGDSRFDYLEELDNMGGRLLDNANFFKVAKLDTISDEELYDRLLNEFPAWLRAAKAQTLIKQ